MKKNLLQEASLKMALVDALPVLFFGAAVICIGISFQNPLFIIGSILATLAGAGKVLYKIILALKQRSVPWLSFQLRILMPVGFLCILLSVLLSYQKIPVKFITTCVISFPGNIFFMVGCLLMCAMMYLAVKGDSSSAKLNWIEQIINSVAQLSFLLGIVLICYSSDYYRASEDHIVYLESTDTVTVNREAGYLVFDGPGTDTALIFYPGAKVEYTAYAPIMQMLAREGCDCFLIEMPYNLSILSSDRAKKVLKKYDYAHYYIAGHSLGGYCASQYLSKHPDTFEGIIFLASYPFGSLNTAKNPLKVLSLYGEKDTVLNQDRFAKGRTLMPENYTEICIPGGNHSGFAAYGPQAGDQKSDISKKEQWDFTVEKMKDFLISQ